MNSLIRSVFVFGALPAVTSSALPVADACSLVSTAEIEGTIGKRQEDKPSASLLSGGGSACTYVGGQIQIVLFSGAGSSQKYTSYLENSLKRSARTGAPDQRKLPVSGIGRSAYYVFPKTNVGILVVDTGGSTVGISMVGGYGVTGESLKPKLMTLAKMAVKGAR